MFARHTKTEWLERLAEAAEEVGIPNEVIKNLGRTHAIEDWRSLYNHFQNMPPELRRQMQHLWQFLVLSGEKHAFIYAVRSYGLNKKMTSLGGENALHYAFLSDNPKQVDRAIGLGISWMSENNDGWNSRHFAALSGYQQQIDKVLELEAQNRMKLPLGTKDGRSIIHFAAYSGKVEQIKSVCLYFSDEHQRLDLSVKDGENCTALNYALRKNRGFPAIKKFFEEQSCQEIGNQDQFTFGLETPRSPLLLRR